MSRVADHAVIIGGSMAGMTTAKAISPYFTQVTIVDIDEMPTDTRERRGVPQSRHLHGLLHAGRTILEELFPGFTNAMIASGAPYFDYQRYAAVRVLEGWLHRTDGDLKVLCARRTAFEHMVRTFVSTTPNIRNFVGSVGGLRLSGDGKSITGVTVNHVDGSRSIVEADLVVDASGRGSRSPLWVEELGFEAPKETSVKSYLGYATLFVEAPRDALPDGIMMVAAPPFPGTLRGGFVVPQHDGTVGIMAAGQNREFPPNTHAEFDEFLKKSTTPLIRDFYRASRPVTGIEVTRTSHNRLRNWHELTRRPRRLLVVGDAAAAYNPVYGQGMSSAALQAKMISKTLGVGMALDEIADSLQPKIIEAVRFPWAAAIESDLSFPGTVVENLNREGFDSEGAAYFRAVRSVATIDGPVARAFTHAFHAQEAAPLFDPKFRDRVLRLLPSVPTRTEAELAYPPAIDSGAAQTIAM